MSELSAVAGTWTKPSAGWLYILDTNLGAFQGQVSLFDPANGTIKGSLATGYAPDFALSPDGSTLYIVSGTVHDSWLAVIDTSSGEVVSRILIPDRMIYGTLPAISHVSLSSDGSKVFVERMRMISDGVDEYSFAVYDTVSHRLLPESAQVPGCGPARLLSSDARWDVQVFCSHLDVLRSLRLSSTGKISEYQDLALPVRPRTGPDGQAIPTTIRHIAMPIPLAVNHTLSLVMADGGILEALGGGTLSVRIPPQPSRWVPVRPLPQSPDGHILYVGSGDLRYSWQGTFNRIDALDTRDWHSVATIRTPQSCWSLTLAADGKKLYAISESQKAMYSFDALTLSLQQTFENIGVHPASAIAVP